MKKADQGQPNGVLVINKDPEITSASVCHQIKKQFSLKKVGHTGTLDPFATGVLVVCLNKATRIIPYITPCAKIYEFTLEFGKETDTLDLTGEVIKEDKDSSCSKSDVLKIIPSFVGRISQIPPIFSALKHKGKALYKYARKGESFPIETKKREVEISELELLSFDFPHATFRVCCSHGTYIRSLARDMANKLGTVGHVSHLKRLKNGSFLIESAIKLIDVSKLSYLNKPHYIDINEVMGSYPSIVVKNKWIEKIKHGNMIPIDERTCEKDFHDLECSTTVRVLNQCEDLLAIGQIVEDRSKALFLKLLVNHL